MFAHSSQIAAGISPMRIRPANTRQPTQYPAIDSRAAATISIPSSTSAATLDAGRVAQRDHCRGHGDRGAHPLRKALGRSRHRLLGPRRGATTRVAKRPSGLSVGPVSTRATKPYASGMSSQYHEVASVITPVASTTAATTLAAFSLTGLGKENSERITLITSERSARRRACRTAPTARRSERQARALGGHVHLRRVPAAVDPDLARARQQAVEQLVLVRRVVVEEQQALGPARAAKRSVSS